MAPEEQEILYRMLSIVKRGQREFEVADRTCARLRLASNHLTK